MKIAVIGLGVIGGSLGLAIKQNNPHATIVGFDSPGVLRRDGSEERSISLRPRLETPCPVRKLFFCARRLNLS